ncbi:flagellar motor protein MotB, partial [Deinococcus marmoris]
VGWDDIKYRDAQAQMVQAVRKAYQGTAAPQVNEQKNDPPGAQRWVFAQTNLFQPGTAKLTPTGRSTLLRFAGVIRNKQELWRRLRIEGHTRPTRSGERDDWLLSSQRAEQVARIFQSAGHVPPYRMAIAGRAGQNPQFRNDLNNPVNERVEFLIEYAQKEQ